MFLQLTEIFSGPLLEITENFCYSPPPNLVGLKQFAFAIRAKRGLTPPNGCWPVRLCEFVIYSAVILVWRVYFGVFHFRVNQFGMQEFDVFYKRKYVVNYKTNAMQCNKGRKYKKILSLIPLDIAGIHRWFSF